MCLALDRGRPGFVRNCTCSALLGWLPGGFSFSLTRLSLSSARFSNSVRLMKNFVTPCKGRIPYWKLPQPLCRNACGLGTAQVWAFPLSLTTTRGISYDFFSSGYWDVSLPPVRSYTFWYKWYILYRVAPFGYHRLLRPLPAHLCFSQVSTSFIASRRHGIRHVRLFTWPYNPGKLHSLPLNLVSVSLGYTHLVNLFFKLLTFTGKHLRSLLVT